MFVAKVVGKVISTQKSEHLVGTKLLIIKPVDDKYNIIEDDAVVAVDTVGAGYGEYVLVAWGNSFCSEKHISADLCIVGIVDEIQRE